jgi:hypothetical protein
MGVKDTQNTVVGVGVGTKKIVAEQQASRQALIYFGQDVPSDTESSDSDNDE